MMSDLPTTSFKKVVGNGPAGLISGFYRCGFMQAEAAYHWASLTPFCLIQSRAVRVGEFV